jgi:branched-chain amino acid aminotransferase
MGLSARQSKIHVAVAVWDWPSYFSLKKGSGLRLITSQWRRPSPETAPVKSKAAGLYTVSTLAKHAAEDAGYHDALMLSWQGHVCEATGANIFFLMEGKLHTPTPDCFLDGITRRTVMDLAKKRGIEIIERTILPHELSKATEVFLTGTAAELTAVEAIDEMKFVPGEVCEMLSQDYRKLVRGE